MAETKKRKSRFDRSKSSDFVSIVKRYWPFAAIAVAVIGLVVIIFYFAGELGNGNSESGSEPDTIVVNTNPTKPSDPSTDAGDEIVLEQDRYPEINQLIKTYFQAKLDKDLDTLNKIVEADHKLDLEDIGEGAEYVSSYESISSYTAPGLVENTYIVYVYYEVKLLNIETPAPSLARVFVARNEDGDVFVYDRSMSDEMTAYATQMDDTSSVRHLVEEVNTKMTAACKKDADLAAFYEKVLNESESGSESTEQ